MKTKEKLRIVFEENRGKYISGQYIAQELGFTRCAVWKAVKSLRADGYEISAVQNRGYCFEENNDVLTKEKIKHHLEGDFIKKIIILKTVDSTNAYLKKLAAEGAEEGTLVIAENQTAGRGRLGRSFYSPGNTGLYMSLLLRPDMPIENAIKITTSAAAAVAEAVEKISGEPTYIKWVNDIYQRRRKICGILSESASDIEHGGLQYVILGIGINVYQPRDGFPDDIKTKAGGIFENRQADMRSILAAEVVSCFHEYYKNLEKNTFFEQYKKRMIWIGQKIYIYSPSGEIGSAVLTGLNSDCSLALCYPDGTTGTVTSGEISINRLSCEKSYEEKNLE